MIQLFRLLPQWVGGGYNYDEITDEEYSLMGNVQKEFTYVKNGRAPEISPYSSSVVFSSNRVNNHIFRPFFEVQSGYIVTGKFREVLSELMLAPCVLFPINAKVRGVLHVWHFCYFYSSLRSSIDLEKSSFQWVDPNKSAYDAKSGKIIENIIERNVNIEENDLDTMGSMVGRMTLRCEKVVLRSEVQAFDMFELDMFPNCLYVNEKTKELLESQLRGLEIIEDSAFIDIDK